jgi:hypothetical protein
MLGSIEMNFMKNADSKGEEINSKDVGMVLDRNVKN